jgi:hypothetical protein
LLAGRSRHLWRSPDEIIISTLDPGSYIPAMTEPLVRCLQCGWVHVGGTQAEAAGDYCFRCRDFGFEIIDADELRRTMPPWVSLPALHWPSHPGAWGILRRLRDRRAVARTGFAILIVRVDDRTERYVLSAISIFDWRMECFVLMPLLSTRHTLAAGRMRNGAVCALRLDYRC